jgi:hypothetical protein
MIVLLEIESWVTGKGDDKMGGGSGLGGWVGEEV